MENPLEFTTRLALATGELLKEYFSPTGVLTEIKSDRSVVTKADLAADEEIRNALKAAFPEDQLLTEESDTVLENAKTHTWVVDPLDGTTNFSLGLPIWGISIARLKDGYPQLGVLYFPMLNEMYSAERGKGAQLNGVPLKIPQDPENKPYTFFTCCSRTYRHYNIGLRYKTRILGAATYDFCAVARGAAIVGFQTILKLWDLASGWLILEEAGGVADILHGPQPFPIQSGVDYSQISYATIMAAKPELLQKARQEIQKK